MCVYCRKLGKMQNKREKIRITYDSPTLLLPPPPFYHTLDKTGPGNFSPRFLLIVPNLQPFALVNFTLPSKLTIRAAPGMILF